MLAQARKRLHLPICVIGGVTLENAEPLVAHGADLLAVVHGLFGADSTRKSPAAPVRSTTFLNLQFREPDHVPFRNPVCQRPETHPRRCELPVRAFKSVGGTPLFFKHAEGAYVTDEDDKRYVDYVGSWGPMILGHSHPDVLDAVRQQLQHGLSYGAPTAMETEMADLVCSIVPSMEMVRMVSSGTEATMSAIRLARGFTGRDNIIKFEGCYHGHSDSLLVKPAPAR